MKKICLLLLVSVFCFGTADAQKRKKTSKKAAVPQLTPQEKLFEELLPATAMVMFVDSVVVDKDKFLSSLPITEDMGYMSTDGKVVSYTNGFRNTCIYASGDTLSGRHLYITHLYGKKWSETTNLKELNLPMADYPFLMGDGVTLYFSAEGEGTLGGRDIYRTTYNADGAEFYEPVNMGMPYNSSANDYMLAISDMDNIGWLVTDRYQPEGKVCIYTFEPTAQRKTFSEDTAPEILKSYARLEHIKDTWSFGNASAAIQRRNALLARMEKKSNEETVEFVVNDNTTYSSLADFHSAGGKQKYQDIVGKKSKLQQLTTLLDSSRESYTDASRSKKHEIGRQIIKLEQEIDALSTEISKEEKALRNAENSNSKKK